VLLEDGGVFFTCVLHSSIGVMDQAWWWLSLADGLFQRRDRQGLAKVRSNVQPTTLREKPSRINAR